MISIV